MYGQGQLAKRNFFFEMLKSAVQKPSNLDHGNRPEGCGTKMPKF